MTTINNLQGNLDKKPRKVPVTEIQGDSKDDVFYYKMKGWEKFNYSKVRELDWGYVHLAQPKAWAAAPRQLHSDSQTCWCLKQENGNHTVLLLLPDSILKTQDKQQNMKKNMGQ